jgi:hypothetical protein
VPDDVDPAAAGAFAYLLYVPAEQFGRDADVAGQRRVVERLDLLPAVLGEAAAQQDEDRAVVDEAVQQDDRGLGLRRQLGGAVRCGERFGCPALLDDAGGIEEEVSGQDRDLQGGGLQQGQGESRQLVRELAREKPLAERKKGQRRPGDLHGRPPVGT